MPAPTEEQLIAKGCHHCHAPLAGTYVATEMVSRDGPRSRVVFCRTACLASWAKQIADEAAKRLAAMRSGRN